MKSLLFIFALCTSSVCQAGEVFASKEFGFMAIFPNKPEAIPAKNTLGDALIVSAAIVEEEPPKVLLYQINVHKISAMKEIPKFDEKVTLELLEKNLKPYITEGGGKKLKFSKSRLSAWPALEFYCVHDDFFREGIISYKRGYTFLIKDTYYKIVVHSLEDNQELKDATTKLFASFSLLPKEAITDFD